LILCRLKREQADSPQLPLIKTKPEFLILSRRGCIKSQKPKLFSLGRLWQKSKTWWEIPRQANSHEVASMLTHENQATAWLFFRRGPNPTVRMTRTLILLPPKQVFFNQASRHLSRQLLPFLYLRATCHLE